MPREPVDLSLSQLRCFLAIVDAGSFSEAGRRLGLSASVVSKTMARLEMAHGVKLLHRSTHAVSPTSEGMALIAPARAAEQALADVGEQLGHSSTDIGGWVRVTASVGFLRQCLVPLLPAIRDAFPGVRLDLRASNSMLDLADHGIDLAIRSGPLDGAPGHVRQRWFSCPWVVCAAPDYLSRRPPPNTPAGLVEHDLIGFRASHEGVVSAWSFRDPQTGARSRLTPEPVLVMDDGEAGWRAALDGLGVARTPLYLAAEALRDGRMIELLKPWRDETCRCRSCAAKRG